MTTAVQLKTRELKPGFGAEILDVDLARADADTLAGVVDTFHRHGAILLRGQDMTPAQLVDFVALFGEPEDHTQTQFTLPGHPKVFVLSNREVDGKPIGAHNDGVGWHTDYSYKAQPAARPGTPCRRSARRSWTACACTTPTSTSWPPASSAARSCPKSSSATTRTWSIR